MEKSWKESGEMSPAEKALEEEGKRRVKEVHQEKIDAWKKMSAVKPLHSVTPRNEESD